MKSLDEKMMTLALAQARKGWGRTSPNPMVGAVVAHGERVVAKGYHMRAGGPHAEVAALGRAGEEARNATIYVTLEPCNHYGRTPPCTGAILKAGIRRVVIGESDPNPHVGGGGAAYLTEKGLDVQTGVLEAQCRALNPFFRKHITTGLPYVILKSAATLDGKLATSTGHSRWVTGEKARAYVHHLRDGVDAILVGRGTVEQDDPTLNTRLKGIKGRNPVRIVLDTGLKISGRARVLDPSLGGPAIVACGPNPSPKRVKTLEEMGAEVWPLPLSGKQVGFKALLERMGRRDMTSLLIEGGAEVNASALISDRVVDRILFFFAPKIVGGRTAPTLVGGPGDRHHGPGPGCGHNPHSPFGRGYTGRGRASALKLDRY